MMEYVTLDLRPETPFVHLYPDSDWPLRPSEVKGLWRWWARALVAGALFEQGFLYGAGRRDALKTPTREETDCISRIVGLDMGLGYADKRESQASCFRIRFERINFAQPRDVSRSLAHRFQLLKQLVRYDDYYRYRDYSPHYIDGGSATLVIDEHIPCSLDNKAVEAALGALALALRLSCFGWGGRRGLGCFSVKAYGRYSSLFNEEPKTLIRRVIAAVSGVVNRAVSRCGGLRRTAEPPKCKLPPTPAVSIMRRYDACAKDSAVITPYMLVTVKGVHPEDLHNFFIPSTPPTQNVSIVKDPRDAVVRTLKSLMISSAVKRPSPMVLAAFADKTAYLSIFTSADWPQELELRQWPRRVPIAEGDILTATSLALKEFIDYVKKLGGVVDVWVSQRSSESTRVDIL
jgi:CRISPR-associated protein Cmr1